MTPLNFSIPFDTMPLTVCDRALSDNPKTSAAVKGKCIFINAAGFKTGNVKRI
jgi:hypothetical protein